MDVRNDGVGVCDTAQKFRDDGTGVYNTLVDVGNDYICIYCKFGLGVNSQRWPRRGDGTHVEGVENPVEVQSPGGDRPLIILRVENSRDRIFFTPLDDAPLNLDHSPAIESLINESPAYIWFSLRG